MKYVYTTEYLFGFLREKDKIVRKKEQKLKFDHQANRRISSTLFLSIPLKINNKWP